MNNISTVWLKHLKSEEERKKFKEILLANREILDVLSNIIGQHQKDSLNEMRKDLSFETPAWSEKQAFHLGVQHLAERLLQIIPDRGGDK